MKQGNLIVAEYEKEFSRLSKYALEPVLIETFRCRQFEDGLKESIKRHLMTVTSLQVVNFYQLVQAAMKIEKSEMKSQERNRERKFPRVSSSSSKMTRDSQVESVHGFATKGRRQGPTAAPSSGRGISSRQGENPKCPHCHRWHSGVCRRVTGGCFRCGSTDHFLANCPRESSDSRNTQGSGVEDQWHLQRLMI